MCGKTMIHERPHEIHIVLFHSLPHDNTKVIYMEVLRRRLRRVEEVAKLLDIPIEA